MNHTRVLVLVLFLSAFFTPARALAFKSKTHVIIANEVLAGIESGSFVGMPQSEFKFLAREALTQYPEYFRAGTLGPDNFPDLIAGQVWVHTDNGHNEDPALNVSPAVPLEERTTIGTWRSIDYGMYLFKRAHEYHRDVDEQEGLRAIAFAYGYLGHMIGDGFAHSLVNEWTGGAWDYFSGQGSFYPPGEEIKHFAVEGLFDDMIARRDDDDLVVRAPRKFLYELMTEEVYVNDENGVPMKVGEAGAFGGAYYEVLVKFRNDLRQLSDHDNWTSSELGNWAIDVTDRVSHIASLGTDLGNPVADVEHFFDVRAELFDVVIEEWIWLNECIAQNMIWTANLEFGGAPRRAATPRGNLDEDACEAINFEPDGSGLGSLYNGELNNAAWGFYDDPGSIGNNIDRMGNFLEVALTEIVKFDPLRDIGTLNKIASVVPLCEPLIEWGSCDNACTTARDVCTSVVTRIGCGTCPAKDGEYSCDGLARAAACGLQPHCPLVCAGLPIFEEIVEDGCAAAVSSGSLHACDLCSITPVCEGWETLQEIERMADAGIEEVVQRATAPLRDAAIQAILVGTFGPYYQQAQDAVNLFRMRRDRGGGVWFVNFVFLQEDLRAGGLGYLRDLFRSGMQVPAAVVAPPQNSGDFAAATWPYLPPGAASNWATAPDPFGAYSDFVDVLWNAALGVPPSPLGNAGPFGWLNDVAPNPHPQGALASRFAAVLDAMGLLLDRPGPTAARLLEQLSASSIDPNNIDEVETNLYAFSPIYNAMVLTWQSLFSTFDGTVDDRSAICSEYPHIMCDGIASLDDPNNIGTGQEPAPEMATDEHEPGVPYFGEVDWLRSVNAWETRPVIWSPGFIGPERECRLGYTAFTSARTGDGLDLDYIPFFRAPPDCSDLPAFVGFDDPTRPWTSTGVDPVINTDNYTEGTGALEIQGCEFQELESPWHLTTEWGTVGTTLSLDVYVPGGPAAEWWAGDLEVLLTVPGQVHSAWSLGNAQLHPLSRDTWSQVTFVIPEEARQAFLGDFPDAHLNIKVNWPDCGQPLLIDNLKWADESPERRQVFHVRGSQVRAVATIGALTFDEPGTWNSNAPLEFVDEPLVEGSGALRVSAEWHTPINSVPIPTSELEALVSDTMSLDVQLPAPDAFNYWTGDIQMFLSCGETLWNSPVGTTVPLTNRFDGEYNTVYFEVTPEQQAAMVAPGEACQFHVALNVTPGGDFVLDNLGFVYPQ